MIKLHECVQNDLLGGETVEEEENSLERDRQRGGEEAGR